MGRVVRADFGHWQTRAVPVGLRAHFASHSRSEVLGWQIRRGEPFFGIYGFGKA